MAFSFTNFRFRLHLILRHHQDITMTAPPICTGVHVSPLTETRRLETVCGARTFDGFTDLGLNEVNICRPMTAGWVLHEIITHGHERTAPLQAVRVAFLWLPAYRNSSNMPGFLSFIRVPELGYLDHHALEWKGFSTTLLPVTASLVTASRLVARIAPRHRNFRI